MLHEFLTDNKPDLIARCQAKVAKRPSPPPTSAELKFGIPLFLSQIIKTLKMEAASDLAGSGKVSGTSEPGASPASTEIGESAAEHGEELHRKGFTVDQVVHDYGDLCQAVTDLAVEKGAPIAATEFRTLNRCLDNAIADAVTQFGSHREQSITNRAAQDTNERLGFLAHELRGKLNAAGLAIEAIKRGTVGIAGATGAVLDRSLIAMRDILDRSFAEVRLGAGLSPQPKRIAIADLIEEVQVFAVMEAASRGITLTVKPGDPSLKVDGDPHTLASALSNLLQNAVKFTPRDKGGKITVSVRSSGDRVLIEVADGCGGLPAGDVEDLFKPFAQHSGDRTGLGLGLSISRKGVEANRGKLSARDKPGSGCVFTIDLPLAKVAIAKSA
ncbi:MAG TPA: HAMP domain-containing sensor histidine kinase [Gemmatimonadales bacterium]|nr:HAMP domain-containing sensor histidine kinase [Gemmatimonadales bacterium]